MPVITVFSGTFCEEESVIQVLLENTKYRIISDKEIISDASRFSGIPEVKIAQSFTAKTSVFNKFTHEKERSIAHMKLALAKQLVNDNLIIRGFISQLIPANISHALRCCLIADTKHRVSLAVHEKGMSEQEAIKLIHHQDEDCGVWIHNLWDTSNPWNSSLYDIVIPTDKMAIDEIVQTIDEYAGKDVVQMTEQSKKVINDFKLASRVEVALVKEGHNVGVIARNGNVTLTINKHVLMLNRLEGELKSIASKVQGASSVETKVGPGFNQPDIYRKYDFTMPSKILLVDDEKEYVQTLSERLMMRDMGSAVAYDGESALSMVQQDDPEVMILDLKMPGIDGIEVLRRVKSSRPEIEVIILTGHGSDADRKTCMELGAFAYLQKPVEIEELSDTLKQANDKIQKKQKEKDSGA